MQPKRVGKYVEELKHKWEYTMIKPLSKTVSVPQNFNKNISCDQINKNLHVNIHNSIICNIQPRSPSFSEQINKMCYIHIIEYYWPMKQNKVLIHATTWTLKWLCYTREARHQKLQTVWFYLREMYETNPSILERSVVDSNYGEGIIKSDCNRV